MLIVCFAEGIHILDDIKSNRVTFAIRQSAIFIDRWHWLLLAGVAPFLLFSSSNHLLAVAIVVVPGLWIVAWLAGREPLPRTPLNGALLLMFIMVLVSLWATYDVSFSLPKISGIILGAGIFYAFAREGRAPRGWWLGFLLYMGIGVGIAVIGLLGTHWINKIAALSPILSRLPVRIISLPGAENGFHPNYVAGALLWVIPSLFTFSWLLTTQVEGASTWFERVKCLLIVLTITATISTVAVLILTQSRESYIALALTLLTLIEIALPARWRWYGLAALAIFVVFLGVLLAFYWDTVYGWITSADLASNPAFSLQSLVTRFEIWSRAIYGIQDFPISGMGMNTFRQLVWRLYPLYSVPPESDIPHAHNEFLQAALDLGIPGLIAFIALYVLAFWMLVQTWMDVRIKLRTTLENQPATAPKLHNWSLLPNASPQVEVRWVQLIVLGLGGGLLAHLLYGLTDAVALGAKLGVLFWMLLGLIAGLYEQTRPEKRMDQAND